MDTLTVAQFKEQRDKLLAILTESPIKRIQLLEERKIKEEEFDRLSVKEAECGRKLNILILKFITDVLTDISQPGKQIGEAAVKLEKTLKSLKNFNRFLEVLSLGIELISNILLAVQSGPGAVAKLINVIERIRQLPSDD